MSLNIQNPGLTSLMFTSCIIWDVSLTPVDCSFTMCKTGDGIAYFAMLVSRLSVMYIQLYHRALIGAQN